MILITAVGYNSGRETRIVAALDEPVQAIYEQDIVRIFDNLASRPGMFRGIDPKARKSGR